MLPKVAINGFGRIGRLVLRSIIERYNHAQLQVVAANDTGMTPEDAALLFEYDSTYGRFPGEVELRGGKELILHGDDLHPTILLQEKDPTKLPWKDMGVDIVIESTGAFTDGKRARVHLETGAKKVIITAPAKNEDITLVFGVNEHMYKSMRHRIISNASCTTNCLAPMAKVLNDCFGIRRGVATTTHAYTNDQRILDLAHKDPRRARAAGTNIIPSTTGAAQAIGLVLPDLQRKLHVSSLRVPVSTVSVLDLVVELGRPADPEEINLKLKAASSSYLNGILDYTEKPLVSSDFRGNPHSAIVDGSLTAIVNEGMAQVFAWYDNEWGYSCRVANLAHWLSTLL